MNRLYIILLTLFILPAIHPYSGDTDKPAELPFVNNTQGKDFSVFSEVSLIRIKPTGLLKTQLQLQKDGLTGQTLPDIKVTKDIEYGQALNDRGETMSLKFDVYQACQKENAVKTKRPVVILVHGGGFSGGDKAYTPAQGNFYPDLATVFASHGYVAFSLNYRLWPVCSVDSFHIVLENAVSDVSTAVESIKRKYDGYGIDTTKIIICGDSAGGGIVVNTSYSHSGVYAGCVDMWGGLRPYGMQNPPPVNHWPVNSKTPPTCIIHGTSDTVVPLSVSEDLSAALASAGVYHELHLLEGEPHYPVKNADKLFEIILNFSDKILLDLTYENSNDK